MPYTLVCPACSASLPGVPEALAGKSIKCTNCREPVRVEPPPAKPPTPKPPVAQSVPPVQRKPGPLDAEVVSAPPAKRPAAPLAAPVPVAQAVPARRPAVPPKPAAKSRRPADDDDDRPARKGARRDRDEEDDEDDLPRRTKSRRDDDDPPRKSAMPVVLGVIAGVVILGGVGAVAAVMLTTKPESAKATETQPAASPTRPQPPVDPPPPPTTRPSTPPTTKPEEPPPPPAEPPPPPPVNPPTNRDQMPGDVLARVERSTVYIEVDDGIGGGGSGSGWFGGEPGLVITNAHVLGMLYPGAKEPAKITVFSESGVRGKQKQYEGAKVKVLAVDRDMDLAVLQIEDKDLPPPMPIRPASQLQKLDKLVCFGFPGGRRLADRNRSTDPPNVTVTESKVSAFRTDDGGNLYSVQMQGGVVHGNSGGPITDLDGNVIGVAVRVDIDTRGQMTSIAYAVPSEYVSGLLAGRAAEAAFGQPYHKGDRVVFPIVVRCADAKDKLKADAVGVGVWVGERSEAVRPSGEAHKEEKGDAGYKEVTLTYDKARKVAVGEIDFPKDAGGRAYWAQPYYTNALTRKRFLAGKQLPADAAPVDRVPADLIARYPAGSRFKLNVTHALKVSERFEKDGQEAIDGRVLVHRMKLKETVNAGGTAGHAVLTEELDAGDGLKIDVLTPEKSPDMTKELRTAEEGLSRWAGRVTIGRDGKPAKAAYQVQLSNLAEPGSQPLVDRLGGELNTALYETAIKLPGQAGKPVEAGATWTDNTLHRFRWHPLALVADPAKLNVGNVKEEVTYTYLGRRDRAGKGEVVVKADGVLRPMTGAAAATCGSLEGQLILDEKTGMVTDGTIRREFVLEAEVKGLKVRVSGTEEVRVTREK